MKRTIRLTENELRNLIAESVKRAINEQWRQYADMGTDCYNNDDIKGGKENWEKADNLFKQQYGQSIRDASAGCTKNGQWSPGTAAYNKYMNNRQHRVDFHSNGNQ